MALNNIGRETSKTASLKMGLAIDEMANDVIRKRLMHEQRWYDNIFFDDGFHFRYVSKSTGQVLDYNSGNQNREERAIPRASRQIRGVANLILGGKPYPVIYPERVDISKYPPIEQQNPETGQMEKFINPEYTKAYEQSKVTARRQGNWVTTKWEDLELELKLIDMLLIAAKTSVSWMQIYQGLKGIEAEVYDGFDVLVYGNYKDKEKLPFIIKSCQTPIEDIKGNPLFDPAEVAKLTPDNRYASSEVKQAYMTSRYGSSVKGEEHPTLMQKEAFIKETISEDNWQEIMRMSKGDVLAGKSKGDCIMRHSFSAGGITLFDEYIDYDHYPFHPFTYETGPLYQVPQIERFKDANKSLDLIMSRVEKIINSSVVGLWMKRKGENFKVSNVAGGQMVEYETTRPEQMAMTGVPAYVFNFIGLLDKYLDEQGASTSALNQLPDGVKSGVAIESVKATEYANLTIPTTMLKSTVKGITEELLFLGDRTIMEVESVDHMEDGEPDYFDVIGGSALKLREELGETATTPLPENTVPIKEGTKVRIEVETGLGFTIQGKRETMQQIIKFMTEMSQLGVLSMDAVKLVVKRFLDIYGFGATQEFMELLDQGEPLMGTTDQDIEKMKVAFAETAKDLEIGGENDINKVKIGVVEALNDMKGKQSQVTPAQ